MREDGPVDIREGTIWTRGVTEWKTLLRAFGACGRNYRCGWRLITMAFHGIMVIDGALVLVLQLQGYDGMIA